MSATIFSLYWEQSGMVTAIVTLVPKMLASVNSSRKSKVSVEIVFPISTESVTRTSCSSPSPQGISFTEVGDFMKVPDIPGVTSGEGCSRNGCESCPYMKMNSLTSLLQVCQHLPMRLEGSVCAPLMGN